MPREPRKIESAPRGAPRQCIGCSIQQSATGRHSQQPLIHPCDRSFKRPIRDTSPILYLPWFSRARQRARRFGFAEDGLEAR